MIGNKPSIYNAQSVYNQGGGVSTYDIDLNGVKNTIIIPPYLIPVEYIDNSNFPYDINFFGSAQINASVDSSKYKVKSVFKVDKTKLVSGTQYRVFGYAPISSFSNNYETRGQVTINSSNQMSVTAVYGFNSHSFSDVDDTKKITLEIIASQKRFVVSEENGNTYSYVDSRNYPTRNWGCFQAFNYSNGYKSFFGQFYYTWITDDNKIISALIPCRSKEPNDINLYVVDVVSGVVACNAFENFNNGNIICGPDLDLDDLPNYFT